MCKQIQKSACRYISYKGLWYERLNGDDDDDDIGDNDDNREYKCHDCNEKKNL